MQNLVMPLAGYFDAQHLKIVHDALRVNDQVRMASSMPPMIEELFERTWSLPGALPECDEISKMACDSGH